MHFFIVYSVDQISKFGAETLHGVSEVTDLLKYDKFGSIILPLQNGKLINENLIFFKESKSKI